MTSILLLISLSFLIFPPPPSSSLRHLHPRRLMLLEEKMRLGSTPPSCHNKCNGCHPCLAVQVPSLPTRDGAQPADSDSTALNVGPSGNRYSSYKPLGWKCRCGDNFYNP